MLYQLAGLDDYRGLIWNAAYIRDILKAQNQNTMENRIDVNHEPRSWKHIFHEPIEVTFPEQTKADKSRAIPEICPVHGRIFLSMRAYDALKPIIENEGEFIPLTYESGAAYLFVPFNVAEEIDALDQEKTRKNQWGDFEALAFLEEKINQSNWSVFRAKINAYTNVLMTQKFKDAMEKAELKGAEAIAELRLVS